MKIAVIGAGAIGSLCGGLLGQAGHEVHLVGRDPHMAAIARGGLRIEGMWGKHHVLQLQVHTSAAQVPPQPCDLVLIATKAYDTAQAVQEALPFVGAGSLVVSLQNGLGNVEAISSAVGPERTVGARIMSGVQVPEPGKVLVAVHEGKVMLGSPWHTVPMPRLEVLAGAFAGAGIPAQATDQILGFIWAKLLFNCSLNPLCALLEIPYGRMLETDETRQMMIAIIGEVFEVAREHHVPLFWSQPEEYRRLLFEELIPATAAHYCSMYFDLQRGKRTEIGAMNGAVARLGEEKGVPTPTNAMVTSLLKAREKLALKDRG